MTGLELMTTDAMGKTDRAAIAAGPLDGYALMRNAGAAVAAELLCRYPDSAAFDVLCGPGNNGGDGYVVAKILLNAGANVRVFGEGAPRAGTDAALAAADFSGDVLPLSRFSPCQGAVVVDALYGAGLARPLSADAAAAAAACRMANAVVVAIDLPSGISGDSGTAMDEAFSAALTVTFVRLKPGHRLYPARAHCGVVIVADIGIPDDVVQANVATPPTVLNRPALWRHCIEIPDEQAHKYSRGHVVAFSGGALSTGAARLSAMAAARVGAGAVTVASPSSALLVNASHLTSTMLVRVDEPADLDALLTARRVAAVVIGPGFGDDAKLRSLAARLLEHSARLSSGVVLDADIFSAFAGDPSSLFAATRAAGCVPVMTPHEGEFRRIFPDLGADEGLSKLERARKAAARSGAVIVYKGPDTVIASPAGAAAINDNATPWLATAGSGDVLAGLIAGLIAQSVPSFEAACAGVWLHAEAGRRGGPGLIADDLPGLVPGLLNDLLAGRL